jgi:hypothetical protein
MPFFSPGNVIYCPGAMLDINGVMLALARECENVDTLLCVSAFEVETLTSNFQVLPSSSISRVWRKIVFDFSKNSFLFSAK